MGSRSAAASPTRIHASSVLVTILVIGALSMLVPPRTASAAVPLPAGVYQVQLGSRLVTIEAGSDGRAGLDVPEDVVVQLSFDEDGRVLNAALVSTPTGSFDVLIDTFGSGAYRVRVDEQQNLRIDLTHNDVVRTVAACSPSGLVTAAVGLPNHGTTVSHAASGMHASYAVTNPVDGRSMTVDADFRSLEGARDFCDTVRLELPTAEEIRALVAETQAGALGPDAARAATDVVDD